MAKICLSSNNKHTMNSSKLACIAKGVTNKATVNARANTGFLCPSWVIITCTQNVVTGVATVNARANNTGFLCPSWVIITCSQNDVTGVSTVDARANTGFLCPSWVIMICTQDGVTGVSTVDAWANTGFFCPGDGVVGGSSPHPRYPGHAQLTHLTVVHSHRIQRFSSWRYFMKFNE